MSHETERRYTPGQVEVRAATDKRTIGGYAAKFNTFSQNLGGYIETISSRAFNGSRAQDWPGVMARYNHDDNMLLGTSSAGTLRLSVDEMGLMYEVDLPLSLADVFELVERRDVGKSSFAFRVMGDNGDEWALSEEFNYPMRRLLDLELVDVAPVNTPAYLDTSAALRSLARHMDADPEEVRSLASDDGLKKFFRRSDRPEPKKRDFGAVARMSLLSRKQDPWV